MAKYLRGINGPFIGKVGTVVGCVWKGKPYMRSTGNPRTTDPSPLEIDNRNKFKVAHQWLQPLLAYLRIGFAGFSPTSEGYNAAKSYNLKHAMLNGEVVPDLIRVSHGDLPLSEDMGVRYENDKLHFSWSKSNVGQRNLKDQVMLLAYHPESKTALYDLHGAFRNMGEQILDTYKSFVGQTIHVYAAFVSADRTKQSNSKYLGTIDC